MGTLFWSYQKKQADTPLDVAKELEAMVKRLCQKWETKEDFVREITLGKFYSLYTPDAVNHVQLRKGWKPLSG